MTTPALFYVDNGFNVSGDRLMGLQSANFAFLRALAATEAGPRLLCHTGSAADGQAFLERVRSFGFSGEVGRVGLGSPELAETGCLHIADPQIERFAWRRAPMGWRRFSLCGITHTTASKGVTGGLSKLVTAPVGPWDGLICTSRAVHDSVTALLEAQADYLAWRVGARPHLGPTLSVQPLGIHCDDFAFSAEARASARQRLGLAEDETAFLFVGRLSFHAKANPHPMFVALQRVAASGLPVRLILCGWFANELQRSAFVDGAARLCPAVKLTVLDGRDAAARAHAWAASDVFTSLADNIQETFGLAPVEAMAAGLPCVVSDWDGLRDTVRDGIDGYRIPTLMPVAPFGEELSDRYVGDVDTYDLYCGRASQAVAVDIEAATQAYLHLARDPGLRRSLGEAGRQRARSVFDWPVVIAGYRAFWAELDQRRRAALDDPQFADPTVHRIGERCDPFTTFAPYPTRRLDESTLVRQGPVSAASFAQLYAMPMHGFGKDTMPSPEEFRSMIEAVAAGPMSAGQLAAACAPAQRGRAMRGIAFLLKLDCLRLA